MTDQPRAPLDRPAIFWAQTTPLLQGLGEDDLSLLLGSATVESHPDRHLVFGAGAPADRFFLVMDGHVELFVDEQDRHSVLEVAKQHAVLGEAALFLGNYANSARVIGFARLMVVPAAPFVAVLGQRVDLALRMLSSMSMRLRGLVAQIAELKLKTTAQRLGGFLLGLTPRTEGAVVVRFPFDKRLAAESLGMSAESLSRALIRLAQLGVESRAENLVAIKDIAVLRAFCIEADPT